MILAMHQEERPVMNLVTSKLPGQKDDQHSTM